jgi:transposase-like protein
VLLDSPSVAKRRDEVESGAATRHVARVVDESGMNGTLVPHRDAQAAGVEPDVEPARRTSVANGVRDGMVEWQNRPLDPVYPVVFIDAIHVKIRDGKVANRPIYVALAVTCEGRREILGLWAGDPAAGGEGAKYWLHVLTEIRNRGVNDVLMVVCDGLTGLPDAVAAVWPQTITQTCVVHLLRNSFRYACRQHFDAIAKALRPIYTAPTEAARSSGSTSSARLGASGIRRLCGCGRTPGPSSSRS